MARWMPAFDAGDLDALAAIMLESTHVVAAAGAAFAICPDNSAHVALGASCRRRRRSRGCTSPRSSAPRPAGLGARRVGVLGTRFTMGGPVYPAASSAPLGIDCVVPDDADVEVVDRIIFDELVNGVFTTRQPPRLPGT